jgi:hypothetical protein
MTIKAKTVVRVYVVVVLLAGALAFLAGCPPMNRRIRQTQQKTEKADDCHDFIMPVPTTFIGDQCPRTDQYAEISGNFVLCHCTGETTDLDGGL